VQREVENGGREREKRERWNDDRTRGMWVRTWRQRERERHWVGEWRRYRKMSGDGGDEQGADAESSAIKCR
jgi:hypothetical protein